MIKFLTDGGELIINLIDKIVIFTKKNCIRFNIVISEY